MNISLSKAKKSKKRQYGLVTAKVAGFGDEEEEDDDDSNDASSSGRAHVNRDLAAEQTALRKRAAAALAQQPQTDIYDYDGAYETFATNTTSNSSSASAHPDPSMTHKNNEPKKSRYVEGLLKAAKQRDRERDVIQERKIAKEQAAEDAEYEGKDKFVTKAYRKTLAERELWAQEEAVREKKEQVEDVTKKTGNAAMAGFYGNLNRNVAMGGATETTRDKQGDPVDVIQKAGRTKEKHRGLGFMDGFEMAAPNDNTGPGRVDGPTPCDEPSPEKRLTPEMKEQAMRKAREEKVARARIRYFQRQGIAEESMADKQ